MRPRSKAQEADAALRVERAVDWIDHDERRAVADHAGFFGNDRHTVDLFEPGEDRSLGCCVDRRCLVAALAGADDRLTVGAQRQLDEHAAHVLDRCAAEAEPVSQAGGRAGPR